MHDRLQAIIAQKQKEVAALYQLMEQQPEHPLARLLQDPKPTLKKVNFKNVLRQKTLSVIAEIKRRSPSKGLLANITNPIQLAQKYIDGGAQALSILTDELFFAGHLRDLQQVADTFIAMPILRKDFIIDEIQIAEAALAGADAILCIVAVMGTQSKKIISNAKKIGLDVLVEVHSPRELEIALNCGADIIGVNNRDLTTFEIDIDRSLELVTDIPAEVIKIAESGINQPEIAQRYRQAGFDAVLIGESLVTADDPGEFIRRCRLG